MTSHEHILRIGDMLLDHYGPAMYSKMTSEFDPVGLAALDNQLGQYLGEYRLAKHFR